MEGLTEIPEKISSAEFEELYGRAVIRLKAREERDAIIRNAAAALGITFEEAIRRFKAWQEEEMRIAEEEAAAACEQAREAWSVPGELEGFIAALKGVSQTDEEIDELIGNVLDAGGESSGQKKN